MDYRKYLSYLKIPSYPIIAGSVIYALGLSLVKWRLQFAFDTVYFLGGSIIGMLLLDTIEAFLGGKQSVFRTIFFESILAIAGFFVITSSGSLVGSGVMLAFFLRFVIEQVTEFQVAGIGHWITASNIATSKLREELLFILTTSIFVLLSLLFLFV